LIQFTPPRSTLEEQRVSSQKFGENGVFWACCARPKHPAPLFIEKLQQRALLKAFEETIARRDSPIEILEGKYFQSLSTSVFQPTK
jgi:hypothetical protein